MCGTTIEAAEADAFGELFLAHCHVDHADLPFPDDLKRAYGESLARIAGSTEQLDGIGTTAVHPVTPDRIEDWLDPFDHRVMADPQNCACYCLEPHEIGRPQEEHVPSTDRRARRTAMVERLRHGTSFGYPAYVDRVAARWVNASRRGDQSMHRRDHAEDDCTVGISCFAVAPPHREHGAAQALRHLDDAAGRGAAWVEAYPIDAVDPLYGEFRAGRAMFDGGGFTEVEVRARDTVVRRPA